MNVLAASYVHVVKVEIPLWVMLVVPLAGAAIAAMVTLWVRTRRPRQDRR